MSMLLPVSVVVLASNAEATLPAALSSIARQTMREFECIVVDDCSTDGTAAIAKRFRRTDTRFRLVSHRAEAGVPASCNSGVRTARGEYVAFLDAEDLLTPRSLEMRLQACRKLAPNDQQRWAGAYCGIKALEERDASTSGAAGPFSVSQFMLRRDAILEVGGFDESATPARDREPWMRILNAGYELVCVPRAGVRLGASVAGPASREPAAQLPMARNRGAANQGQASHAAGAIYFFPHSAYHVWTIGLIAPALRARGVPFVVVDLSTQTGDPGLRSKLAEIVPPSISYSRFVLEHHRPGLVVAFNDWDRVIRPIFAAARVAGVPTAAIVEGIQDYDDVDTGRVRNAYRTAEAVILPGAFDRRYFGPDSRQRIYVGGVPRVRQIRERARPVADSATPIALINSNFSYNVLTEHRDAWVRSAVAAARAARLHPVISRHPSDVGREHAEFTTAEDFYTALGRSVVTIQRFASGILEALAMGRGVIYFNPHGERIDKFKDPLGAYRIATTQAELVAALEEWPQLVRMANEHGPAFLDLHAGSAGSDSSIVDALVSECAVAMDSKAVDHFHTLLWHVDIATAALTTRKQIFPDIDQRSLEETFASLAKTAIAGPPADRVSRSAAPAKRSNQGFQPAAERHDSQKKRRQDRIRRWRKRLADLYRRLFARD